MCLRRRRTRSIIQTALLYAIIPENGTYYIWSKERNQTLWFQIILHCTTDDWVADIRISQETFLYICEEIALSIHKDCFYLVQQIIGLSLFCEEIAPSIHKDCFYLVQQIIVLSLIWLWWDDLFIYHATTRSPILWRSSRIFRLSHRLLLLLTAVILESKPLPILSKITSTEKSPTLSFFKG